MSFGFPRGILLENSGNITLVLSGSLNVSNIESTYIQVVESLSECEDLRLDISDISETDLTFVQLIEAARRQAREAGGVLSLCAPADGSVLEVLRRGGFLDDERSERTQFWLQGASDQ